MTAGSGGGGGGSEYGVEWDYSNPSPVLTRIGDAAGFSDPAPATSLTGTGSSPFDRIMPWAGMKRYNIINGEVAWSEDDARYSETAYDTVVYIPEFYYSAIKDVENSVWTWKVSPTAKDGFEKHPGSGRYIGRFHTSGGSSGVFSKSGVVPLTQTGRPDFRIYSHSKGAKWWMLDIVTWSAVQLLYLVEFSNFNSQEMLGMIDKGNTVTASGETTGALYHTIKRTAKSNQYRWIEDPFANVRDFLDGFIAFQKKAYLGTNNSEFSDDYSRLTDSGVTLPESEYISGFGFSNSFPWAFIPDKSGGSESNFVTDYSYSSDETCCLYEGGRNIARGSFGLFNFNADNALSYTSISTGSRLIYIP